MLVVPWMTATMETGGAWAQRPSKVCTLTKSKAIAVAASHRLYRALLDSVSELQGHIYMLSQQLQQRGHKVIVITHAYAPDRVGVRYITGGLKVYHVPHRVIARQDTLPNFFGFFPVLRSILIREEIDTVHAHQALSSMGLEAILHARTMDLRAIFTDHSLFGFADTASILTNKLLHFFLADIDNVVCVSHIAKENTVLRANMRDSSQVFVVPNAIVAEQFCPDATSLNNCSVSVEPQTKRDIKVVILSRLMYRKGIDLLLGAIPRLCARHPNVRFIVGGDGPKRIDLEQMRERYALHDRVELCGAIRGGSVRDHLLRGDIFLNTSLTEAFGTGIVEAASCGLLVVSTNVGGVPEVLPHDMIRLVRPDDDDIVGAMDDAIAYVQAGKHDPYAYHDAVARMYSWAETADRVENVYRCAHARPRLVLVERLARYRTVGPIAGIIFCIIAVVDVFFLRILEHFIPAASIDRCDVPQRRESTEPKH